LRKPAVSNFHRPHAANCVSVVAPYAKAHGQKGNPSLLDGFLCGAKADTQFAARGARCPVMWA